MSNIPADGPWDYFWLEFPFSVLPFLPLTPGKMEGLFFKLPGLSTWGRPLEVVAAEWSLRTILISVGLFLVIDSFGTALLRLNHLDLAVKKFVLQMVPFLVFLVGDYYLLKALL